MVPFAVSAETTLHNAPKSRRHYACSPDRSEYEGVTKKNSTLTLSTHELDDLRSAHLLKAPIIPVRQYARKEDLGYVDYIAEIHLLP